MIINKQKLYNAMEYIVTFNQASLLDMDFSDMFGVDLTEEEKKNYFWGNESKSNIEIVAKIIDDKLKKNE